VDNNNHVEGWITSNTRENWVICRNIWSVDWERIPLMRRNGKMGRFWRFRTSVWSWCVCSGRTHEINGSIPLRLSSHLWFRKNPFLHSGNSNLGWPDCLRKVNNCLVLDCSGQRLCLWPWLSKDSQQTVFYWGANSIVAYGIYWQ